MALSNWRTYSRQGVSSLLAAGSARHAVQRASPRRWCGCQQGGGVGQHRVGLGQLQRGGFGGSQLMHGGLAGLGKPGVWRMSASCQAQAAITANRVSAASRAGQINEWKPSWGQCWRGSDTAAILRAEDCRNMK